MKSHTPLAIVAAASLLGMASPTLFAHDGENHDTQKAANGGQLRVAGPYHLELVVARDHKEEKEGPLVVHLTDQTGAKVSTIGAAGTATILAGKQKTAATLVSDGDNRLKGSAKYASTPDMKIVVSVSFAGKTTEQARFTPLAVTKGSKAEH